MNIAIRYFTRTGNTEKLAKAISSSVDAEPLKISTPLSEKADILFLGSSVYAAGVDDSVKKFIISNADKIGLLVNFSTAALLSSTYNQIKKFAEERNIKVASEEFHCRGSFSVIHRGRPNENDLKSAEEFAKKVVKKYEK